MFKFDIDEVIDEVIVGLAAILIIGGALFGGSLLGSLEQEEEVATTSYESRLRAATLEACADAQAPIEYGEGFYLSRPSRTKVFVFGVPKVVEMEYKDGRLVSCEIRD
jgi:hypothetical protein